MPQYSKTKLQAKSAIIKFQGEIQKTTEEGVYSNKLKLLTQETNKCFRKA